MNETLSNWLAWLAGVSAERPADATAAQLTWTNAPHSWSVFLFVAVVLGLVGLTVAVYRREIATCSRRVRWFLAAVRITVIALLMLVFLGPALTYTRIKNIPPVVVLLRDASFSMSEKDRYLDDDTAASTAFAIDQTVSDLRADPPSRADIINEVLQRDDAALLGELEQRGKVRVIDFARDASVVDLRPARSDPDAAPNNERPASEASPDRPVNAAPSAEPRIPPLVAQGQGTNILRAVRAALQTPNVAAILLWSDGQHTVEGTGRNELLSEAIRARDLKIPIHAVGIGDPTRITNLKVVDLYATPEVWKNDPFEIQAVLGLQNVTESSVQVELLRQRLDDGGSVTEDFQVVKRKQVELPPDKTQVRVSFDHTVKEKGDYAFTIRAEPLEDELNTTDNQPPAPIQVRVLSDIRVLLLAGEADWEYQLVRRLLQREKSVTLSCWLQHISPDRPQDGDKPIDRMPSTDVELREYDVLMLLDPDPRGLPSEWIQMTKDLVGSEGRGFFYMAGSRYATPLITGAATRGLGDLLPVEFGDLERLELETLDEDYSRPWGLHVEPRSVDQAILRFHADSDASLRQWQSMPPIYWSFPAQEPKPAGRVLIARDEQTRSLAPDRRPLLVSGMYGAGRTVYMGFNGTWRWRRTPNDVPFYRRFWLQMIRYLVEGRSAASEGRGVVETDRERYALGDRITVYVRRLKDAAYQLRTDSEVTAILSTADGDPVTVELKAVAGQPGSYSATTIARNTGLHSLSVNDPDESADWTPPSSTFRVALPQLETKDIWLNKPLLTDLAEASQGAYFELDQLDELSKQIPDRSQEIRIRGEPIPLWDNSRVLFLLVGLLCVEWAVRKRNRLI